MGRLIHTWEEVRDIDEAKVVEDASAEECAERVLESNRITNFLRLSLEAKEDIPLCIALLMKEEWKGPGSVYGYQDNRDRLWIGEWFEITFNGAWRVEDLDPKDPLPNATYGSLLEALQTTIVMIRDYKS